MKANLYPRRSLKGMIGVGTVFKADNDTIILVDEYGNEIPAVLVDEEVEITATENDIRLGTTAITDKGVIEGKKVIPSYHTTEGTKIISSGKPLVIKMNSDNCQFTKLYALVCSFNTTLENSVSTEMVMINDLVYMTNSTEPISKATVNMETQTIELGIINTSKTPYVIRFMTYKEEN